MSTNPKIVALQLTGEGLIQTRMRRILSFTRRRIDAVKAAFGQPDAPAEGLPALRMITYPSAPLREGTSVTKLPPVPVPKPDRMDDDLLELHRICEAIGLDVREVTRDIPGEAAPRAANPVESNDLGTGVSDDVLRLIEHVEANNPQRPGLFPSGGNGLEAATRTVRQTRGNSAKPANRQSLPTSFTNANDLADFLASLKLRLLKIRLAPDDMSEAQAEITTAIAQLLSSKPKQQIISISLQTLVSILEETGPAALTKDIETSLTRLRAILVQLDA